MKDKLIDMLYENNVRCDQTIEHLADDIIDIVKAEAYKELAERLKQLPYIPNRLNLHKAYDNLLKELVGDNQ